MITQKNFRTETLLRGLRDGSFYNSAITAAIGHSMICLVIPILPGALPARDPGTYDVCFPEKRLFEFECARVQLIIFAFPCDKLLVIALFDHVPVV